MHIICCNRYMYIFTVFLRSDATTTIFFAARFVWVLQWNLYNADTIGAILSKEMSLLRRLPVGVAMRTLAIECYEGMFHSSPLLYNSRKE